MKLLFASKMWKRDWAECSYNFKQQGKSGLNSGLGKYGNGTLKLGLSGLAGTRISKSKVGTGIPRRIPANNNKVNTYSRCNVSVTVFIISQWLIYMHFVHKLLVQVKTYDVSQTIPGACDGLRCTIVYTLWCLMRPCRLPSVHGFHVIEIFVLRRWKIQVQQYWRAEVHALPMAPSTTT